MGTQTIEVINQEPYMGEVNDRFIDPTCFSKMTKLKFLRVSNVHFPKGLKYLSNDLRVLEWSECSLKSLPSMFEPKHLYELEMCSSQLKTLWRNDLELPNLRSINLSFSKSLTKIPDLTSASNLVKLNLEGCASLTSLHGSVLLQNRLRYLNLKGCTCLISLGTSPMEMEALEALLLSGCSKLEYIPEFGKNMKRLEHLYVDGTRIKKLPVNLGEMSDLRNLDVSGTFIKELPSSIYGLKKLRLLYANRCPLLFKTRCFLNPGLDTLSSGLKEVDLSYCNLSVVPAGIGLLSSLITLDLSGNEFVSLPASIGILSKLRMLCLNNCKRLQSLPKLSSVDEDMDYGPRSRFNYYISAQGIDVSKFHASSFNSCPTISCLNCPKLAVNKHGSYPAQNILNSYLKLWTEYWMIPEAVFEIVGAGSKLPSGFVQPGSEGLILRGPWIGVAICAVISVHHFDGYMEPNHTITAHIHLGEKHWKIPVSINFMVAESETQLLFYCTEADDLQRIVGSSQMSNFGVSFSVEPRDSNLHITKYGVYFIREEYITRVKRYDLESVYGNRSSNYRFYVDACDDDKNLHHHVCKIINFIAKDRTFFYLGGIHEITKGLLETNQEFFRVLSSYKEWKHKEYVYCYYVISLGASVLYKDFVRSLNDINDGWLSVKVALEQFVVKSRADNFDYKETMQQLSDLEATQSIGFSDKFIRMFFSICSRTFDMLRYIETEISNESKFQLDNILPKKKIKRMEVLAKKTSITIAAVFCMMAVYSGAFVHLKEMRDTCMTSIWERLLALFHSKKQYFMEDGRFRTTAHDRCELQIFEFYYHKCLLQDLMIKMAQKTCFTKEEEKETVSVIHDLQKSIHNVAHTIQKMSMHADQYSHNIGKARKHVKSFSQLSKDDDIISMLPLFD